VTLRHERIHAHDCARCVTEDGYVDRLHREIRLDPARPPEQRAALLAIADKCPVHRTLTSEVVVATTVR
jgi:putative redox protein